MKRKEFFLVVILILFGLTYHFFTTEDFFFFEACSSDSRTLLDKKHPHEFVEKEARFANIKTLKIHNPAGDIKIQKSDNDSILVKPVTWIFHRNREKAIGIEKDIQIFMNKTNGDLEIEVVSLGKFPYQRARILFQILLPETAELKIINRYGDVDISGIGQRVQVDEKYGNIFAKDIISDLKILHGYGRITLDNITGKTEIDTRYSTLRVFNARSMGIDSRHTKIQIVGLKDGISLRNTHDLIDIRDVKGNINLDARHCTVRLLNIDSELVVMKNTYNGVFVENLWSENVDISVSHGDLNLRYFEIKNKINIQNRYSRIKLEYPKSINPLFNISLIYGKIMNETPVLLHVLSGKYKQNYTSQEGNPEIIINNTYGDVILRNIENEPVK